MTDRKTFRRWVRELKRRWPSLYPVRVLLVPPSQVPEGALGYCQTFGDDKPERFTIYVADNQSTSATADTLAEEWSHVLRFHAWRVPSTDKGGHDGVYGAWFNEIKAEWLHEEA